MQRLIAGVTAGAVLAAGALAGCAPSADDVVSNDSSGSSFSPNFEGLQRVESREQGPAPKVRSVAVDWRGSGRMPVDVTVTAVPVVGAAERRTGRLADELDFKPLVHAPVGAIQGEHEVERLPVRPRGAGKPVTRTYQIMLTGPQSRLLRNYALHYRQTGNRVSARFADELAARYVSVLVRQSKDTENQGKADPGHDHLDFSDGTAALPGAAVREIRSAARPTPRRGSAAPTVLRATTLPEDAAVSDAYTQGKQCFEEAQSHNECAYEWVDGKPPLDASSYPDPLRYRVISLTNTTAQPLALNGQPVSCVAANGPNASLKSQQLTPDDRVNGQWIVDGSAVQPPSSPPGVDNDGANSFYALNDTVVKPNQSTHFTVAKMGQMFNFDGSVTSSGALADQDANPPADAVQSVSAFWQTLAQVNQAKASGATDSANIYQTIPKPVNTRTLPITTTVNPNHDKYALNWAQAMPSFWAFLSTGAATQSGETVQQLEAEYKLTHPVQDRSPLWLNLGMAAGFLAVMLIPGVGEALNAAFLAYSLYGVGDAIYNVVESYIGSQPESNPTCETGLFAVGATGVGESGFPYQVSQIYQMDGQGNVSPANSQSAYNSNGLALSQYGSNWANVFDQIVANNINSPDDYRAVSEAQKQQWAQDGDLASDDSQLFISNSVAPKVSPGRDLSDTQADRSDPYSSSLPTADNTLSQIGWVDEWVSSGQADPNKDETVTCASPVFEWPGPNPAVAKNPSALSVDTSSNAGGANLVIGSGVQTGLDSGNTYQANSNAPQVSVFAPSGGQNDANPNIRWLNGSNNTPTGDSTQVGGDLNSWYSTQIDGDTAVGLMPGFDGQSNPQQPQNYFFYAEPGSDGANAAPELLYPYAPDALPGIDTNVTFNCITGVRYGLLVNPEALIISNLGFGPRTFWMPSPQLTVAYSRKSQTNKPTINKTPVTLTKTYSTAWLQSGIDTEGINPLTDSATLQKYTQSEQTPLIPGSVITLTLPAPTAAGPWQLRSGGDEISRDNTNPQSPTVMVRVLGEPGTTTNVVYSSGKPGQDGSTPPNCAGKVAAALYDCEAALQKAEATFTGIQVPLK